MRSKKSHCHTLGTSDEDKSVMKSQAWGASGRPAERDTELSEAAEGRSSRKEQHVGGTEARKGRVCLRNRSRPVWGKAAFVGTWLKM